MKLVAVFLEDQDRSSRGYTVNFGGNYRYIVDLYSESCSISRLNNKGYIGNLFDKDEDVVNVSAIVGANGCGKTTLIYDLINHLNGNYRSGFSIWEEGEKTYIKDYIFVHHKLKSNGFSIEKTNIDLDTIYYSAFIDHKVAPSGIDISADRYLESDIRNIDRTYDANERVLVPDRLKRSDYNRFIKFQQSAYSKIISEHYGLLNEDLYRVVFTRHKIDADTKEINFDNTPFEFRAYLNRLYLNIRSEYDEFDRHVSSEEERYELNKKQFKNFILMDIFCLLIRLMERSNLYLQEGKFKNVEDADKIITKKNKSYEQLIFWLQDYYYIKGVQNPLPHKEVIDILEYLYKLIDSFKYSEQVNKLDWRNKCLYLEEKELNKLLDLNEQLLLALPRYYLANEDKKSKLTYDDLTNLQQFVSPEFASRRLSSGETAMLNLYSKLYDYFRMNILITPIKAINEYYILFLDEADLGYHPTWKISFVSSIIEFCKGFFRQFGAQVQIVFSTHDALSLSDIPKTNVTYLTKDENDFPSLIDFFEPNFPKRSFAANVTDLLSDSFFLEKGLMGEFARTKIDELIKWLNRSEIENKAYFRNLIDLVDEPLLKYKLDQMYFEKFPKDIDKNRARQEIEDIAKRSGLDVNFNDL